jgi:hypothetical protein
MARLRLLLILLLLAFSSSALIAQDNELKVGVRAGHNAALGVFAALSLETEQIICQSVSVSGGLQYNTIGKTALELCPSYHMDFDWGKVSAELLAAYTNLTSINSLSAGVGARFDCKSISARLGYYYHLFGGNGDSITEPFNIYYELRAYFLKKLEKWNLDLVITNCEIFELERHYQPSFIVEGGVSLMSRLGISLGLGCKPSGIFNLSADYYQSFLKTGVCYRW